MVSGKFPTNRYINKKIFTKYKYNLIRETFVSGTDWFEVEGFSDLLGLCKRVVKRINCGYILGLCTDSQHSSWVINK